MNNYKTYHISFLLHASVKFKGIAMFFLLVFLNSTTIQARDIYKEVPLDPINTFDEVPVEVTVKGYLSFEADVLITDKNLVYINVAELFKNLGLKCVAENNGNILKGFIVNENSPYVIDFETKEIIKGDKTFKSINGIVKEIGGIYIETNLIKEAFGLNMIFNFRSLSIKLEADFELPMVKQARIEKMRENVTKLRSKNEIKIDTVIGRKYHLLKGGVMDWGVASNQTEEEKTNTRYSIGLGSELLYGEAKIAFNYYDQTKFDRRQLYYNWRWVDNDNTIIKQAQLGRIGSQTISFLGAPVIGASFNNSPNTVRKATGTYTISEFTEPNWNVELYINDALVDYTQADASGLYVFKVPIVYGYTKLTLKFFGPLGEERIDERAMNTPYTFMPQGILEYKVSGGVLQDDTNSRFGRSEFNYGLSRFVTIGGGMEYLSSIIDNPFIPFAQIAFQPFSKLVINMEYAQDVNYKGLLNYTFGRSAFLEVDYTKFIEGQKATIDNANEMRKVSLTLPFKISVIRGTAKLSVNQFVYDVFNFNRFDAVFSGSYKNYSTNITLASNWIDNQDPFTTTTVQFSRRTRNGLNIRPSFQYNNTDNKLMRIRTDIEKRVAKMNFSAGYERNIQFATNNAILSFRYDLNFARTGVSSSYNNNKLMFSENAQGSMAFGADNGTMKSSVNSAMGRGGILFYPFLDLNQNGKKETNEPMVLMKNVKITGGKVIISEKDSIARASDLNAFIKYTATFSDSDLDNISWRFKHKTYEILVDPNQFKKVDVPIIVLGEINGTVYLKTDEVEKGQGRITIQIFDKKGVKVAETQSESDGYYSYLGLKPGNYIVMADPDQLLKLGYKSTPASRSFTIEVSAEGSIIQGVSLVLSSEKATPKETIVETPATVTPAKTTKKTTLKEKTVAKPIIDTNKTKESPKKEVKEKTKITQDEIVAPSFGNILDKNSTFYTVQLGVFKKQPTAKQLQNLSPVFYEILPNGMIRYLYGQFSTLKEAKEAKNYVIAKGIKEAYLVGYKNGEKLNASSLNKGNGK